MIVIFKKIALIIIQMVRTFASLLFLLQVILHFAQGARLLLYENIGHEGLVFEGDINENCTSLVSVNGTVSSVNTNGACVYLYKHDECLGRRLKLDPGTHNHDDLKKHDFSDKIRSFKNCSGPGHFIYGRLGLYDHIYHKGLLYEGDIVEKCTNVRDEVNDRTSSANTDDTCVFLYEHPDCQGRRLRLQPRIHSHNDLTNHDFNDIISSFKACGASASDPIYGRIRLYEHAEHKGLIYEGDIKDNCTDLPSESQGAASSINTDGFCLELYDQVSCMGQGLKLEPSDHSHDDLAKHQFDNMISSYKSCNKKLRIRSKIMSSISGERQDGSNDQVANNATQGNQSNFWILMGMGILAAFIVLFAVGLIILYRKYRRVDTALRKLTPEEVQEFLLGRRVERNDGLDGAELALSVPFTKTVAPEAVQITSNVLGTGHYGTVYKGYFGSFPVAVKTFKPSMDVEDFKAILVEAKIMAYISDNPNVVLFLGADVTGIMDRKITLVTEFCPHGDLQTYLRQMRSSCQYVNVEGDSKSIELTMALWCGQIASAMEHLEDKSVVHGDLAARNVLVFSHELVKITDFGLSKQLYSSSEYLLKRKRDLPWRWCSFETLTRLEFSTDSDIWAFGVTAWEIFSLGRIPWEGQLTCQGLIRYLEQGGRMAKPDYANDQIHQVMLDCWKVERTLRPRFSALREFFNLEGLSQLEA